MQMVVDRPGYFGRRRDTRVEFYDDLFGVSRWAEVWQVGNKFLPFQEAVKFYDEAYLKFLKQRPDLIQYVMSFGECYDNDPSNIKCGCKHDPKACPRHIQDVSVRRALYKLGVWFNGPKEKLLEIRANGSNGCMLSPFNVPFHRPDLIPTGEHAGPCPKWCKPGTVEAWWQSSKAIIIDSSNEPVVV